MINDLVLHGHPVTTVLCVLSFYFLIKSIFLQFVLLLSAGEKPTHIVDLLFGLMKCTILINLYFNNYNCFNAVTNNTNITERMKSRNKLPSKYIDGLTVSLLRLGLPLVVETYLTYRLKRFFIKIHQQHL